MMQLEFLEQGANECPLIRIFGCDPASCKRLKELFEQLSIGEAGPRRIDELPGMQSISDCRLVASSGRQDQGVARQGDVFLWSLMPGSWDNVAGLLEPFCRPVVRAFSGLTVWAK
jgi:hypothetical protein